MVAADGARVSMPKGKFVLMGTAVAGERHIAFLKEVAGGKSRVVKQGEQINGVLVATVTADRVKFTQGDDSEELVLKAAPGPKTTTQPAPPAAPVPAPLPGAAPPVAPATVDSPPPPARRPAGAVAPAMPTPAQVPGATPSSPTAPAAAAQGTAASPDPAWNETFERMRQRRAPAAN